MTTVPGRQTIVRGVAVLLAAALVAILPTGSVTPAEGAAPTTFAHVRTVGSAGSGSNQFSGPWSMAFGPDGLLYVIDHGNQRVQVLDRSGVFVRRWSYALASPDTSVSAAVGIGIDTAGLVYIADGNFPNQPRVQVYSSTGTHIRTIGATGAGDEVLAAVRSIAVHGDHVYVSDGGPFGAGFVKKYTLAGTYVRKYGIDASAVDPYGQVEAIAVGPDGTLYVAHDRAGGELEAISAAGVDTGSGAAPAVTAIAVHGDGRVALARAGGVDVFGADLEPVTSFGSPGDGVAQFRLPFGVAFDPLGNVWVSDYTKSELQLWGDATPPTVLLRTPPEGAVYPKGKVVEARFSCVDAVTGLASCRGTVDNGARLDTSRLGARSLVVTAVDNTGNVRTVSRRYTVQLARPDVAVRRAPRGRLIGDDIYGSTSGQTLLGSVPAGRSVTYVVVLQNDAGFTDRLRLEGPGSVKGYTVTYRSGPDKTDVTRQVVGGRFRTSPLAPGATVSVTVKVTAGAAAEPLVAVRATATSVTHDNRADTVVMATRLS
jgi:hypothetical protein